MVILPVGSGKGGVGKSLLAANLAIALAESGRRVVLADLDLGASNAHTMLGMRAVKNGIGTFLSVPRSSFADIVLPTDYENLSFVPGDAEVPGAALLKAGQRTRLIRCLSALPADYLVLDLGPGTGANPLDFFLLSASGIVVTTPGLTSVLNAYLFLKNAVFRLMDAVVDRDSRARELLDALRKDPGGVQRGNVPRILEQVKAADPASHARITAALAAFRPRLVLNMLEDPADADRADKLCRSARDYLGVELTHLGVIFRDELQAVALSSRIPIVRWKPGSVLSRAIYRISEKVVRTEAADRAAPPWSPHAEELEGAAPGRAGSGGADLPALDEAEADFRAIRQDVEDLLSSGALSMPDLVEAVRSQQVEIDELRRENALLRERLRSPGA